MKLGLIAGKGVYPEMLLQGARAAGVESIVLAAFEGETFPQLAEEADFVCWLKVGQLGKMISFFKKEGVTEAVMAGQITPKRLFDLRPDLKAIIILMRLKKRNAETLFGAVADELQKNGIHLLPATEYMSEYLAPKGHIAGPKPSKSLTQDLEFGWPIAKKVSEMDIGQTIVVKEGTVLAVEGFEGTDAAIRRGGELGHGGATVIKVSKPNQDFRFDVPVIGANTLHTAAETKISAIICEAGKTLILGKEEISQLAEKHKITLLGA